MYERTQQLSVFLENRPGELSRLAHALGDNGINILALSIQDPAEYLQRLFQARQQTSRRIASAASYGDIQKEASRLTLIRFVTADPAGSVKILEGEGYSVQTQEVISTLLENKPGQLASISEKLAGAGINIDYTYGSAQGETDRALYVFRVSDTNKALEALG